MSRPSPRSGDLPRPCRSRNASGSPRMSIVSVNSGPLGSPDGLSHHRPDSIENDPTLTVPLLALALYVAAGFAVAVAFLVFGVTPRPAATAVVRGDTPPDG